MFHSRLFLAALLGLIASGPVDAQTVSTWKGGDGNWSDATKWTGPVPSGADSEARIDDSNPKPSNVTLDADFTVGKLTLSSDALLVGNGRTLTLDGSGAFTGAGTSTGSRIELKSAGATTRLFAQGDVTITSQLSGTVGMDNVLTGSAGSTITFGGFFFFNIARIGAGAVNLINEGSIATGTTDTVIEPAATFLLTNDGILSVAKTLQLAGAGTFTLDGFIAATTFNNSTSVLTRSATTTLTNFNATTKTLTGGRYLVSANDGTATINLNLGPILVNAAAIEMISDDSTFSGLEAVQTNAGTLKFNGRTFTTAGAFANTGVLTVAFDRFTATGAVTNSGTIQLSTSFGFQQGFLDFNGGYTQSAGALKLGGTTAVVATVNSPSAPIVINGGRLEGGGTVTGNVQSNAVLAPFTNFNQFTRLTINGTLTLGSTSSLEVRAGDLAQFNLRNDSIVVSGACALDGVLKLTIGTTLPAAGSTFTVLSAGSLTGTFDNVGNGERLRTADSKGSFLVRYGPGAPNPNAVVISDFVPTPPRVIGQQVPGEPVGTVFAKFGPPAHGPFGNKMKVGKKAVGAIFAGDGSVRVRVGGAVPAPLANALFSKFGEPSGDSALATIKAPDIVTPKDDQVLLSGLIDGPVRIAVREGVTEAAGLTGITVKTFGTIDGGTQPGDRALFRATLQGEGVDGTSDTALCVAQTDGTFKVLVREGQTVGARTVKIIGTLVAIKGTLAEGRSRNGNSAAARLTFDDGSSALYTIPFAATDPAHWGRAIGIGDTLVDAPLAGAKIAALGLPGSGQTFLAKLLIGESGVAAENDVAIFRPVEDGLELLAQESGDAVGVPGGKYKLLTDPIGGSGSVAFSGTATGVPSKTAACIWFAPAFGPLELLARVGNNAPGGGKFAKFGSLALPDGADTGPVFTATLTKDTAAQVTAQNSSGLWAADGDGNLQLLLRTGTKLMVGNVERTVKGFVALVAASGSIGAARGYDNSGQVTVLAKFTDKTVALIDLALP